MRRDETAATARRTILVTDASRGCAIAVIRSLGRAGYRVIAADSEPRSLGFHSRWVAAAHEYPAPEQSAKRFCDTIESIVKVEKVDLVMPVTDLTQLPLAAERLRFATRTLLASPSHESLAITSDKDRTLALARRLGIAVPETRLVNDADEAVAAAHAIGWPVVLKPQFSVGLEGRAGLRSHRVTYAASDDELVRRMRVYQGRCGVLLQRYVAGQGCGVELLASEGRTLAAFQHVRIREVPPTGGASSYRRSVALDADLFAQAQSLIEALKWTGLAMVEFKLGAGGPVLMEINGRVWGSLPLALAAGVDFPAAWARLLLDGEAAVSASPRNGYRIGVRGRDLQRELVWIGSVLSQRGGIPSVPLPPRRAALRVLAGLPDPRCKFDLWDWHDPRPALLEWPRICAKLWRKRRPEPDEPGLETESRSVMM
jgi:predicted ATP-grasp superfamily ATP-dependent carboligase